MIRELSDDCLFVLPNDFNSLSMELRCVNETVTGEQDRDVILDLSLVEMLTSSHLSNLLILKELLEKNGRRLVLCNVNFQTKCEFTACGLRDAFRFADDKPAALAILGRKTLSR